MVAREQPKFGGVRSCGKSLYSELCGLLCCNLRAGYWRSSQRQRMCCWLCGISCLRKEYLASFHMFSSLRTQIMVQRSGRLFHIDFGHFLGNFKKKFGIKRERAKVWWLSFRKLVMIDGIPEQFVFTPDFLYVMGGKGSKHYQLVSCFLSSSPWDTLSYDAALWPQFVESCCKAYNILRQHASLFVNLFAMVRPCMYMCSCSASRCEAWMVHKMNVGAVCSFGERSPDVVDRYPRADQTKRHWVHAGSVQARPR